MATARAGSSGAGRRGGVVVAGLVLLLLVEAQADVALQGGGGQPLLREAALQEGDAGAEVCQSVDPAGDFSPTQQLERRDTRRRVRTTAASVCLTLSSS